MVNMDCNTLIGCILPQHLCIVELCIHQVATLLHCRPTSTAELTLLRVFVLLTLSVMMPHPLAIQPLRASQVALLRSLAAS